MGTIPASENEFPSLLFAEGAAPSTPAAGLVICYAKADGLIYCKDDAGTETPMGALPEHLADTSDAHDASAISVLDTGAHFTGTDVEAVLAELYAAIGAGGIPATILDAKGDIVAATAADTAARLAVGTNGQALIAASGESTGLKWGIPNAHGAVAYHNTTQTVNAAVVPLNSEVFDTDGYHDTGSNTSRLTVPSGLGGIYIVEWGTLVVALAAGEFGRVRKTLSGGGANSVVSTNVGGTNAVTSGYMSGSCIVQLAAGDYVELFFTGNRTLGHASAYEAQSHLGLTLIGA